MGADGACSERAVARLLEPLLLLAEIDGDGDDFGAIGVRQPRDGDHRIEPAGVREHDALAVRTVRVGHGAA